MGERIIIESFISFFRVDRATRKEIFQRGMLFALVPTLPFIGLALVQNLSLLFNWPWREAGAAIGSGDGLAGTITLTIYGLAGVVLAILAMRNFGNAVRGWNLISLASVGMFPVALFWVFTSLGITILGLQELFGVRIMPP
jgi:hypothetical protein